jgi:hypothetical protein
MTLNRTSVAEVPKAAEEILARTKEPASVLREWTGEIEQARRLPADRPVVSRRFDLLRTWSIRRGAPMDRWPRDVSTLCQHLVAQDRILRSAGAYPPVSKPEFGIAPGIV